jgi:hypothetical protein
LSASKIGAIFDRAACAGLTGADLGKPRRRRGPITE